MLHVVPIPGSMMHTVLMQGQSGIPTLHAKSNTQGTRSTWSHAVQSWTGQSGCWIWHIEGSVGLIQPMTQPCATHLYQMSSTPLN